MVALWSGQWFWTLRLQVRAHVVSGRASGVNQLPSLLCEFIHCEDPCSLRCILNYQWSDTFSSFRTNGKNTLTLLHTQFNSIQFSSFGLFI